MSTEVSRADLLEGALIDVALETWKLRQLFERVLQKLDAGEQSRFLNQLRYAEKRIVEAFDAVGLKLVNIEGQAFDPGTAATALNLSDFGAQDELLVDRMLEPIVMGAEGVRRQGTILLRKVHP